MSVKHTKPKNKSLNYTILHTVKFFLSLGNKGMGEFIEHHHKKQPLFLFSWFSLLKFQKSGWAWSADERTTHSISKRL